MAKQKIIIDCDTGKDDAIAIMTAAGSADLELLAVTTVAGNVEVSLTTANSLRVLEYLGLNVPVYAGCDRPLVRDQILAKAVHGRNGLLNRDFVELTRSPEKEHAVSYLIRTLMAGDGDIVVC
ncbi:nucleoside hydrolase, partial [Galactobacillus timonensis]